MKPGLIIKQNKCEVNFNSTYPLKMHVHKIQVCFTICLIESVSNSHLVWIQMHQFCHISWPWHFLLCKSNQRFSSLCPQSTNFLQYLLSSSACVFCMISYCLNWNLVPFHIITNCFHAWKWHIRKIVHIVHHLLPQIYLVHISLKMGMVTADESSRPSSLSNKLSENELVSMLAV